MEILKATLHDFIHRLESHWVRFGPTIFRRVYRSICVGFLPLEKSPGGFCSQATFRVRFPKPPWNLFYTTILPAIDYCGPGSSTDYGGMNCIPWTIQHAFNSAGFALIHFPAGGKEAIATKILLDWRRPPPGWVKVNYDGSFSYLNGDVGAGWVPHDDIGTYRFDGSTKFTQAINPLEPEGIAFLHALQSSWCRGIRKIVIEGDCMTLHDRISQSQCSTSSLISAVGRIVSPMLCSRWYRGSVIKSLLN